MESKSRNEEKFKKLLQTEVRYFSKDESNWINK